MDHITNFFNISISSVFETIYSITIFLVVGGLFVYLIIWSFSSFFKELGFTRSNWVIRTTIILFLIYVWYHAGPGWALKWLFGGYVVHRLEQIYKIVSTNKEL
jgi:hypothetical protein